MRDARRPPAEADILLPSLLPFDCYMLAGSKQPTQELIYAIDLIGAGWRIRTPDLLITNQPLYQLS
jgi:hypothetical protein